MGTRATTRVKEGRRTYVNLYRQMDGYPCNRGGFGHGKELHTFLKGMRIVNGFGIDSEGAFNGAGCLAAALVAHFKKGIGSFYILPDLKRQEEWDYCVKVPVPGKPIWVEVRNDGDLKFKGTVNEFGEWLALVREENNGN